MINLKCLFYLNMKKVLIMWLLNESNKNLIENVMMFLTIGIAVLTGFFLSLLALGFLFPYALDGNLFAGFGVCVILTGYVVACNEELLDEVLNILDEFLNINIKDEQNVG